MKKKTGMKRTKVPCKITWYLIEGLAWIEGGGKLNGIVTVYRLGGRNLSSAGTINFCLLQCVQTGSSAHPTSYPVGTGGKTVRA
jgi:hypothetical protein